MCELYKKAIENIFIVNFVDMDLASVMGIVIYTAYLYVYNESNHMTLFWFVYFKYFLSSYWNMEGEINDDADKGERESL